MKTEQLSDSNAIPKTKLALEEKYQKENKDIEKKEKEVLDKIQNKESTKLPQPTGWRIVVLPLKWQPKQKVDYSYQKKL